MRKKKKPYIALKHRLARERRRQAEKAVYDKKTLANIGFGFKGQIEEAKKNLDELNEKAKIKSRQRYNRSTLLKRRTGGGGVPIDLKTSGMSPWSKPFHRTLK